MVTLYGIPNCDTVKKARKWLDGAGIAYRFHDFRKDGLGEATARAWVDELGWETLVNRRSATWKQLDPSVRESMNTHSATKAVLEHPTLIKRPVLDTGDARHVGFDAARYAAIFG